MEIKNSNQDIGAEVIESMIKKIKEKSPKNSKFIKDLEILKEEDEMMNKEKLRNIITATGEDEGT